MRRLKMGVTSELSLLKFCGDRGLGGRMVDGWIGYRAHASVSGEAMRRASSGRGRRTVASGWF